MKKTFWVSLVVALGIFLALFPIFNRLTSYLHPIVLLVVAFCLFLLIFLFQLWIRKETINLSYSLLKNIMVVYTLALLVLLFFRPNAPSYLSWNLIPFSTIVYFLSGEVNGLVAFYNLAANIGLFIPYGIFLMAGKKKSILYLILAPLLAISGIEVLQLLTNRGSLDIDDLILNVLGVFIGSWIFPLFQSIVHIYQKN